MTTPPVPAHNRVGAAVGSTAPPLRSREQAGSVPALKPWLPLAHGFGASGPVPPPVAPEFGAALPDELLCKMLVIWACERLMTAAPADGFSFAVSTWN